MHQLVNFSEIFSISNALINKDFERCYWDIYRESGAIIHTVILSLRAFFYITLQDDFNMDPLHDLIECK